MESLQEILCNVEGLYLKARETECIGKDLNFHPRNDFSFRKLSKLQTAKQENN